MLSRAQIPNYSRCERVPISIRQYIQNNSNVISFCSPIPTNRTEKSLRKWLGKNRVKVPKTQNKLTQSLEMAKMVRVCSAPDSNLWLPWLVGTRRPFLLPPLLSKTRLFGSLSTRNGLIRYSSLRTPVHEGIVVFVIRKRNFPDFYNEIVIPS